MTHPSSIHLCIRLSAFRHHRESAADDMIPSVFSVYVPAVQLIHHRRASISRATRPAFVLVHCRNTTGSAVYLVVNGISAVVAVVQIESIKAEEEK